MTRVLRVFFNAEVQLGNGDVEKYVQFGKDCPRKFKGILMNIDEPANRLNLKHKDWEFEVNLPLSMCYFHRIVDKRISTIEKARAARKTIKPPGRKKKIK